MRRLAAMVVLAAAAANAAAAEVRDAAEVVAAERAFAADGAAVGVKRSFLKHSAPNAILFAPDVVNAHENLKARPDPKPGEVHGLSWWPLWAGIARSGDFGFTTGPFAVNGQPRWHYFTVWRKQSDGQWKWIFDGGFGGEAKDEAPPGSPAGYLAMATAQAASASAALAEVKAAEAQLNAGAASDQKAAILAWMAPDGRVHVPGLPPAKDPAAFAAALATRPAVFTFTPIAAESSSAGDLVWTYGAAKWSSDGQDRDGFYVRMWQNRTEGWRVVFDQIVPKPPTPPPAPPASSG